MTDEIGTDAHLMKRLLSTTPTPVECLMAADRIEALIAERDAAEAKLAKAVEALDYCIKAPFSGWTIAQGYARAAIARVKGETK